MFWNWRKLVWSNTIHIVVVHSQFNTHCVLLLKHATSAKFLEYQLIWLFCAIEYEEISGYFHSTDLYHFKWFTGTDDVFSRTDLHYKNSVSHLYKIKPVKAKILRFFLWWFFLYSLQWRQWEQLSKYGSRVHQSYTQVLYTIHTIPNPCTLIRTHIIEQLNRFRWDCCVINKWCTSITKEYYTSVTPSRSTQVRSIDEFRTDFLYDLERLARRERCASATNDTTPATTSLIFQSNYIKISFVWEIEFQEIETAFMAGTR